MRILRHLTGAWRWFDAAMLGTEYWRFEVKLLQAVFLRKIQESVKPASRWVLLLPFDYSRASGPIGYFDGDRVILKVKPKSLSLRSVFSSSPILIFSGMLFNEDDRLILSGSYHLVSAIRWFMILFCCAISCSVLVSLFLAGYFALYLADGERALTAIAVSLVGLSLLLATHFVSRAYRAINRPFRDELNKLLRDAAS